MDEDRVLFSVGVAAILREARENVGGFVGREPYDLYDFARGVMSKIARVDAFYVGVFQGAGRVLYPYTFDGTHYDDPGFHLIGADGPAAWILHNKRTYTFDEDGGGLIRRGVSFGDVRRCSEDVVTVPFLRMGRGGAEVVGMASMHSYEPHSYGPEAIAAFEWMCRMVSRLLDRTREDAEELLAIGESANSCVGLTLDQKASRIIDQLGQIRRGIEQSLAERVEREDLVLALSGVYEDCARVQSLLVDLLMQEDDGPFNRFAMLTPAQRAVARLLAEGLGNADIATALHCSCSTVKTHMAQILRKYSMETRQQVALDVRAYLRNPGPRSG